MEKTSASPGRSWLPAHEASADGRPFPESSTAGHEPADIGALFGPETEHAIAELGQRRSLRAWAAIMLALDLATCRSFLIGRRVLARRLDGEVLRRALRGGPLPPSDDYIAVTGAMLDAVAEAGPLVPKRGQR